MEVTVGKDPEVQRIIASCYSHVEALDRSGRRGVGVTNLKRVLGCPVDVRVLVEALAKVTTDVTAVAAADPGAAPLAAVGAHRLGIPAVFVRAEPKRHLLSYGGEPATNHPLISGERLEAARTSPTSQLWQT